MQKDGQEEFVGADEEALRGEEKDELVYTKK